ncbi:hypothetical protein GSI_14281 [Ganoderma sinense ZZ0214-1]|uniref:Uncharacterized protein n=1 Tax=Ganoderma sinense ZZ0214-1 TaxID=1077348 RepID=A0A2G8RSN5_9APHY|nr:hypothetical protein GSI_14281 [Ganoderma sinense ZZ0214-1]
MRILRIGQHYIPPRASALVFSMILAPPSTDGSCSEDLSEVGCSIITAIGKGLRATTFRNDVSREALMGILPSFHAYLSSLEALLRMNPTFLTEHAWKDLVATGSCLAADYRQWWFSRCLPRLSSRCISQ